MAEITIKCGFGSISGLEFRDDIVKKGAALLAEGHMGDIKEVRSNGKVTILARCVPEASIRILATHFQQISYIRPKYNYYP